MLTRITYLYRDASNYKFWGTFVVDGQITQDDVEPYLFDHTCFVPQMVGLEGLQPASLNEDDHDLHEFHAFEPTEEGKPVCAAGEFVKRMKVMQKAGFFPR